ncbi:hypothetical protein FA95DRAFT_778772 [Auriscalpium vulgare]|uniref:Uncharacterized protein n=1 Tax=Auriscalpium vulgare TaxID=40419 RepID=A0ACB8S163_9AGAM|nr:hypothetical protein FA95DRAFT_778772 [Auriscalpium vulgare]
MSSDTHRRTASQPLPTPPLQLNFSDHVHALHAPSPLSATTTPAPPPPPPALAGAPTLVDFLHTTPAPLVAALVRIAPTVSAARHALEVVSWSGKERGAWLDGGLLLAAWWALALFADYALPSRYLLPIIVLGAVVLARRRPAAPQPSSPPITEAVLQTTLTDLSTFHTLLPPPPSLPAALRTLPLPLLARALLALYAPYLLFTYLVPLRILIAVAGTLLLTHRAPAAQLLRAALWRSAYVRWAAYKAYAALTGTAQPFAPPMPAARRATLAGASAPTAPVRFAFTVHENQRWWVGLDWTAALLPNERPSWCDAALQPVPPPAAFALPPPTTAFLPAPGNPNARERRVASWVWEDSEWSVVVKKGELGKDAEAEGAHEEDVTDAEGWVYGDNKWESRSGKGSISKYTRYRRWTRIALLTETIDLVGPGPTGIVREDDDDDLAPLRSPGASAPSSPVHSREQSQNKPDRAGSPDERRHLGLGALRQRLQAAVAGGQQ